jgi:hypothetical protein
VIYIASPYWSDVPQVREDRFILACRIAAEFMRRGEVVFSPIAHSHSIAKYGRLPAGHAFNWMAQDLPMLENACKLVVAMLPGWRESKGIAIEVKWAARWHILTRYLDCNTFVEYDSPYPECSEEGSRK